MASVRFELRSAEVAISFNMDDCEGLDHFVVNRAREQGLAKYEEPLPSLMCALIGALPGTVLDIGANTGLYALLAAGVRDDIRVHAFEPLDSIADRLENNLALNVALADRISVHRLALSDTVGEATFFETIHPNGLLSTTSSFDEAFSKHHGQTKEHRVSTATLDSWVAAHDVNDVSFIKIDVESHEHQVVAGGQAALATLRPIIGIELLGGADFDYFRRFIADNDYVDCEMRRGGIKLTHTPKFVPEGWNHLFVPTERLGLVVHLAQGIGLAVDGTR